MKTTPHTPLATVILLCLAGCFFCPTGAIAAPSDTSANARATNAAAADEGRKKLRAQSQEAAVLLFEVQQDRDAVDVLTDTNIRKFGTAGWHLETGNRLLGVAWKLSQEGKAAAAMRAAALALEHTRQAIALAGTADGDLVSNASFTAALIQERFFGDLKAAAASFRAGARLATNKDFAETELRRLENAMATPSVSKGGTP